MEGSTLIREKLSSFGINSIRDLFVGDKVIWAVLLFLSFISLIVVFSSSSMVIFHNGNYEPFSVLLKQIIYLISGLSLTVIVSFIICRCGKKIVNQIAPVLYGISFVMLILTFFSSEVNGANRWINILGMSIQPSELAKLALVLFIARILGSNQTKDLSDKKHVLFPILLLTGIIAVIVLISNFSTSLFIVVIMLFMLFIGRLPWKQLFALLGIGFGLVFVLGFIILKEPQLFPRGETWQKRIVSYSPSLATLASGYNPETDYAPIDNYQVEQSKIAIAEGGIIGKMPGNSTQRYKLSQAYCDFIYAIIVEEMGLVGALIVLFLYIVLLIRITWYNVPQLHSAFSVLVVLGLTFLIVAQSLLHMGVVVNILPATGQTLPIISSGGSSLLITCIEFGIILGLIQWAKENPEEKEKNN